MYEFRYILGLVGVLTVSYKIYMREEGKKQVLGGKDIWNKKIFNKKQKNVFFLNHDKSYLYINLWIIFFLSCK